MTTKKAFNPFYFLLLIAGTVFAITAFAYGVMMLRFSQRSATGPTASATSQPAETESSDSPNTSESGEQMMNFLAEHGTVLILVELAVLAVLTVGAIGTDEFWMKRAERASRASSDK